MDRVLREYYPKEKVIKTKDYVYARGEVPVALVAHADTVHVQLPSEIFYDKEKNVIWSPQGIGADDRAGIYAIIDIIREGYRPTIIICNEEEVGGKGARRFVKAYPKPLDDISFMIELDRQGKEDMVFYSCDNPEFEEYLEPYGFKTDWGSYSDIASIAPKWGIAAVNFSIGYIDEHTKGERLYVDWMFDTIRKVKNILSDEMITGPHPFIFIEGYDFYSSYFTKYGIKGFEYDDYDDYWTTPIKHSHSDHVCDFCGRSIEPDEEVSLYDYGQWWHLCETCVSEVANKCVKCGKYFLSQNANDIVCEKCGGLQE